MKDKRAKLLAPSYSASVNFHLFWGHLNQNCKMVFDINLVLWTVCLCSLLIYQKTAALLRWQEVIEGEFSCIHTAQPFKKSLCYEGDISIFHSYFWLVPKVDDTAGEKRREGASSEWKGGGIMTIPLLFLSAWQGALFQAFCLSNLAKEEGYACKFTMLTNYKGSLSLAL